MHAAAVGHFQMSINRATDIHFSAIDDGDISGNGSPQIERLGDDLIAIEGAAFLAHDKPLSAVGKNCKKEVQPGHCWALGRTSAAGGSSSGWRSSNQWRGKVST